MQESEQVSPFPHSCVNAAYNHLFSETQGPIIPGFPIPEIWRKSTQILPILCISTQNREINLEIYHARTFMFTIRINIPASQVIL